VLAVFERERDLYKSFLKCELVHTSERLPPGMVNRSTQQRLGT
jgi:hypothetical protein